MTPPQITQSNDDVDELLIVERFLVGKIKYLYEQYEKEAKPLIKQLCRIRALKRGLSGALAQEGSNSTDSTSLDSSIGGERNV